MMMMGRWASPTLTTKVWRLENYSFIHLVTLCVHAVPNPDVPQNQLIHDGYIPSQPILGCRHLGHHEITYSKAMHIGLNGNGK